MVLLEDFLGSLVWTWDQFPRQYPVLIVFGKVIETRLAKGKDNSADGRPILAPFANVVGSSASDVTVQRSTSGAFVECVPQRESM